MPADPYFEPIHALIEAHGHAVQPVLGDAPCVPDFAYTVGLREHDLPELIVFALDPSTATHVLNLVTDRLRVGTLSPEPGLTIHGLVQSPRARARLGEVRPAWARHYGRVAHARHGVDVPFLQVLISDGAGRLPGHSRLDREVECLQPVLAHTVPFLRPLHAHQRSDRYADPRAGDVWLAVPIFAQNEPVGRYELLRAARVGDREVEVIGAPWQADHVTTGDRVGVRPATTEDGRLPPLTVIAQGLTVRGPNEHLVFLIAHHNSSAGHCAEPHPTPTGLCRHTEVHRHVRRLLASGLVAAAADSHTRVHLATRNPEAVRRELRPFLRDGALIEDGRHTAVAALDLTSEGWWPA